MTHIDTGIQDTEPIRFLELLGLGDEEFASYTIRLNGSKPEWGDLLDTYYSSYDDLMRWIFTKKWQDTEAVGKINTGKVLQFIQLRPEDSTRWLFVGAYDILDEYTEEDGDPVPLPRDPEIRPSKGQGRSELQKGTGIL